MIHNKKAAMELSMGTVVIVVLSVSLLIFGMILIRNIMCSGLTISQDISAGVKNEVKNLFSTDTYGVHCMGEGSQEIKLATGGTRKIICILKAEEATTYDLVVTDLKSLKGVSTATLNTPAWLLQKELKDISVSPGEPTEADVLILNIPSDAPASTIRATIEATHGDVKKTVYSTFYISPTGFIKSSIC